MPTSSTRRISYVVPFPPSPPPWLQLPSSIHPRNGSPFPLLFPSDHPPLSSHASIDPPSAHPQHSLGVPALALDTSTQLAGRDAPQGILYTGGRDGLLAGWELGMRLRKRSIRDGYEGRGKAEWVRWNELGVDGEDEGDEEGASDGAGASQATDGQHADGRDNIPFEERWEVEQYAESEPAPQASFRQSCQFHTDWVNDILLTNLNRTLISASSDRTIRAWSPHSADHSTSSTVIGTHTDFVKCLAHSRHQSWVASGGFDRCIKLWDVGLPALAHASSSGTAAPLLVLNQSVERTEKSSIYSLATNDSGSMVASGSPEQTINVWDPRMGGAKRIAKLVGHTDNVRSLLLSEDGRFMLSGSADATVKLWSMSAQRVIHTFTHHSDSVWSLASTHPNLERFYAGDRSGVVSVTDLSRCSSIPQGESYVLCQEGADRMLNQEGEAASLSPLASRGSVGINKIVSLDDQWVWTSTSSSDVHLWKDIGSRTRRVPGFRPASLRPDASSRLDNGEQEEAEEEGPLGQAWARSPPQQPSSILAEPSGEPTATLANMTKRLSLDDPHLGHLNVDRTFSRESTVAFALKPHAPSPAGLGGAMLSSPLANLHRPSPSILPFATRSVSAQTATPVASAKGKRQPAQGQRKPALDGVPYESLVSLGQPDSPYGSFGFSHSRHSIASGVSLPRRSSTKFYAQPSGEHSGNPTPKVHHAELPPTVGDTPPPGPARPSSADEEREARFEFEEREVVSEAVPLRHDPADIIKGRSGLVRSLMLNDRQHAITLSTTGVIAVWNIVLGTCLGLIAQEDVLEAHVQDHAPAPAPALTPRGALELVKERIEGEAVVPAWCTVDTKIGALGIHMEQGRCFDAEIHVDELGDAVEGNFREDQRVSLGKLLLANLFAGFVDAEIKRYQSGSTTTALLPNTGITRASAPTQISFPQSSFKIPSVGGTTTPGALSALATPAMTPALAPEASEFFQFSSVVSAPASGQISPRLHPNPQPAEATTPKARGLVAPGSPQPVAPPSVTSSGGSSRDYFSMALGRSASTQRRFSSASSAVGPAGTDEAPTSPTQSSMETATTPGIVTPGGSFLGKFKSLGKSKKMSAAIVATPAPVAEMTEDQSAKLAEDEKYPGLSEADRYQRRVLENLLAQEVTPPNPTDVPFITSFPDATIFIDEESKDAGAWAVTYRGLASTTAVDVDTLEMALPTWVLEFLLTGRSFHKDPVKISFILEPEDKDDLAEMPGGNSHLSANRALRARKISTYVVDRLGMGIPRSRAVSLSGNSAAPTPQGSPKRHNSRLPPTSPMHATHAHQPHETDEENLKPEDVIEILCAGVVVPPKMTLAAVKHVFRQSGDVHLKYRRKQGIEFAY